MQKDARPAIEKSRRPGPWWLVVGLVIGLVIAPTAAVAATLSLVNIAGPNGTKAVVTKDGQLLTVSANAESVRYFHYYRLAEGTGCTKVFTAPTGQSLILTQVSADVWDDPSPGASNEVLVTTDPTCHAVMAESNPGTTGAQDFQFDPGVVIPPGKSLYAQAGDAIQCDIVGSGYLVPVADAPSETLATFGRAPNDAHAAAGQR
jgi:hypothetical protein